MTWLSLRSGMASIGVVSSAQYPQAPTSRKKPTTRKRLRSDVSMSQLITCSDTPSPGRNTDSGRCVTRYADRLRARRRGKRVWRKLDDTEDAARAGLRRRGHRRTDRRKDRHAFSCGNHRSPGAAWRFAHALHRGATTEHHSDWAREDPHHGDADHEGLLP